MRWLRRWLNKYTYHQLDHILLELQFLREDIMGDFDRVDLVLDKLNDKVTESNETLGGLAQEIIDLRDFIKSHPSTDNAQEVARLADKAQVILDKLAAAEDAADEFLPKPAPVVNEIADSFSAPTARADFDADVAAYDGPKTVVLDSVIVKQGTDGGLDYFTHTDAVSGDVTIDKVAPVVE